MGLVGKIVLASMLILMLIFPSSTTLFPVTPASAQTQSTSIPSWIKNNAKWWSEGSLGDDDFLKGIQYLIQQGIIAVPATHVNSQPSQGIPSWVKNTAKWWAQGQLGDSDFVKGIQYLVQNGIISTSPKSRVLDTTSQIISAQGGNITLSGGSSISIRPGTFTTGQTVTVSLLSSLPTQPPSGIIVGVGPALRISFGPQQTSYDSSANIIPSANGQTESTDDIQVTLNVGDAKSISGMDGSSGIADVVDLQGNDHFVGIPEQCDPSDNTCTFAVSPTVVPAAQKIILSQANINSNSNVPLPAPGMVVWDKNSQKFVTSNTIDPTAKTLVLTHGIFSTAQDAYGECVNEIMEKGGYTQVIGFNYDYTQNPEDNGKALALVLDHLKNDEGLQQVDVMAHSYGTITALSAYPKTSMKINHMILEGGPIDGTPPPTEILKTIAAYDPRVLIPLELSQKLQGALNSGMIESLQPNSPDLIQIKRDVQQKITNTNDGIQFIRVAGDWKYANPLFTTLATALNLATADALGGAAALTTDLYNPFSGPNDGLVPTNSACAKGELPGPDCKVFSLKHTDLECNDDVVNYVTSQLNQSPSSSGQVGIKISAQPSLPQSPANTQGQSVRGCAGYRTCEDYCQFEIGSDYHYDASTNSCVESSGGSIGIPSSSSSSSSSSSWSSSKWPQTWTGEIWTKTSQSKPGITMSTDEYGKFSLTIANDGSIKGYGTGQSSIVYSGSCTGQGTFTSSLKISGSAQVDNNGIPTSMTIGILKTDDAGADYIQGTCDFGKGPQPAQIPGVAYLGQVSTVTIQLVDGTSIQVPMTLGYGQGQTTIQIHR